MNRDFLDILSFVSLNVSNEANSIITAPMCRSSSPLYFCLMENKTKQFHLLIVQNDGEISFTIIDRHLKLSER